MSKEFRYLIIWSSKSQVFTTLPDAFKKLYPKVRVITDCKEVYYETPSFLEVQANLWSDYKHHCPSKFLVAITPNGAISWILSTYGGCSNYIYIIRNSGFFDLLLLKPYDTVMAGGGFKIKSDLAMKRCYLAISPSAAKGSQKTKDDVSETNCVTTNVHIFVEKVIARLKWFRILKYEITLLEMPLLDDIIVCNALCNLLPRLCQ